MKDIKDCARIEVFHEGVWVHVQGAQLERGDIVRYTYPNGKVCCEGETVTQVELNMYTRPDCVDPFHVNDHVIFRIQEEREKYLRENKWLQNMLPIMHVPV